MLQKEMGTLCRTMNRRKPEEAKESGTEAKDNRRISESDDGPGAGFRFITL